MHEAATMLSLSLSCGNIFGSVSASVDALSPFVKPEDYILAHDMAVRYQLLRSWYMLVSHAACAMQDLPS